MGELLNSDFQWSNGTIFYNFHKSAMTQEIETMSVASEEGLAGATGIEAFDSVDADVLKNYAEFSLACTLYGAVKENFISEQAARMISMDGASKNAGDDRQDDFDLQQVEAGRYHHRAVRDYRWYG